MTVPDDSAASAEVLRAGAAATGRSAASGGAPAHPHDDAEPRPPVTDGSEATGARAEHDGRLQLFAYLQAPEHRTYLAIMRLFTSTLLADLSAGEVAGALAAAEHEERVAAGESDIDTVIDRLKQLVRWGNLVVGRRETVAASIAEFQHGSVRYQVSKLAVRVQRDVDTLLRVPEGAREVSRELLPAIERGLAAMTSLLAEAVAAERGGNGSAATRRARERLGEQVTTVFLQHAELAATVRDFYAYLGQVVTRHQLAPDEISGFRNLLVDYIQVVVEDVLRHTDTIAGSLTALAGVRGELLRVLGPADDLGGEVERARGRTEADWQELTDWFVDSPDRPSQVSALRESTARAIGSLLASIKRATSDSGLVPGRRADLLKLARWFDESDQEDAHRLYAAAFGLHSARHLLPAPDYDSDNHDVAWSDGPVLDVPVSVRSRGDRGARGRASRVLHDPMTEETLLTEARADERRRFSAISELAGVEDRLDGTRLSPDALGVLCELLSVAMAGREHSDDSGSAVEPARHLHVSVRPDTGRDTVIRSASGTLTLRDTALAVRSDDGAPSDGRARS